MSRVGEPHIDRRKLVEDHRRSSSEHRFSQTGDCPAGYCHAGHRIGSEREFDRHRLPPPRVGCRNIGPHHRLGGIGLRRQLEQDQLGPADRKIGLGQRPPRIRRQGRDSHWRRFGLDGDRHAFDRHRPNHPCPGQVRQLDRIARPQVHSRRRQAQPKLIRGPPAARQGLLGQLLRLSGGQYGRKLDPLIPRAPTAARSAHLAGLIIAIRNSSLFLGCAR